MVTKDTETRHKKIFIGESFTYKLSEGTEEHFKMKYKKDPAKAEAMVTNHIQRAMRKHTPENVSGETWEQDANDIFKAVIEVITIE